MPSEKELDRRGGEKDTEKQEEGKVLNDLYYPLLNQFT